MMLKLYIQELKILEMTYGGIFPGQPDELL